MKYFYIISNIFISITFANKDLENFYLNKGINDLYNYNFDSSLSYLDSAIYINPKNPIPYFVKISAKWLNSQVNIRFEESHKTILSELNLIIPFYEKLINNDPKIPENYLYLGSAYGLQARIHLAKKKWIDVIWSGLKGLNNIKISKKLNPDLHDVLVPIGMMEYFISLTPKPMQMLSSIMGMPPDRENGLKKLYFAYNNSDYSWIESGFVLSHAYLHFENQIKLAEEITYKLTNEFPGNPNFIYMYAECILRSNQLKKFELLMEELKSKPEDYPSIQRKICLIKYNYLMSIYHYRRGELDTSITYLKYVIDNYQMEMDWLLGYSFYMLGKIYDLKFEREQAKYYYEKVVELNNLFLYQNWAMEYLKLPFFDLNNDPMFILNK